MPNQELGAVILAGGVASRLGHMDKPLLPLNGREIIRYVIEKASLDAAKIVISVNRNQHLFDKFELPLIADSPHQSRGPLIGIYSAMAWFKAQAPQVRYMACFPADVPLFPMHIAATLLDTLLTDTREVICCQSGEQIQPLFSVWSLNIFDALEQAIKNGVYGPKIFFRQHPASLLKIENLTAGDFFNINTLADFETAKQLMSRTESGQGI